MRPRDEAVLAALKQLLAEGTAPSVRSLGSRAGIKSPSAVHASLLRLEKEGKIALSREGGRAAARSVRLLSPHGKKTVSVPLYTAFDPLSANPVPTDFVPFLLTENEEKRAAAFPVTDEADGFLLGDIAIFLRAEPVSPHGSVALAYCGRLTVGTVEEQPDGTYAVFGGRRVRLGGAEDVTPVGTIVGLIRYVSSK